MRRVSVYCTGHYTLPFKMLALQSYRIGNCLFFLFGTKECCAGIAVQRSHSQSYENGPLLVSIGITWPNRCELKLSWKKNGGGKVGQKRNKKTLWIALLFLPTKMTRSHSTYLGFFFFQMFLRQLCGWLMQACSSLVWIASIFLWIMCHSCPSSICHPWPSSMGHICT